MKYVYVVTSVELGWDCVCGVYENVEDAYRSCFDGNPLNLSLEQMETMVEDGDTNYVVHAKKLK
jgi:hypothetical protein